MKNVFNKLILSLGIGICLIGCRNKPVLYEEIKTDNAKLIHIDETYFLKGKFDFITDEKHARRFNGNTSAVVEYKITYEIIENGSVDRYGNKADLRINKSYRLIDVWPKEEKKL